MRLLGFLGLGFIMLAWPACGQTLYAVRSGANDVAVIDTRTEALVTTIPIGTSPGQIAASPNGAKVYVGYGASPQNLSVIDTATNLVTATIPLSGVVGGIAVSPDSSTVYATIQPPSSTSPHTVAVISASTNTVSVSIPLGTLDFPVGIAVTPNGSELYVADSNTNQVTAINTATNAITTRITCPSPWGVAITPNGLTAYVTSRVANSVFAISTSAKAVTATIPGLQDAFDLAITPDGSKVYVTDGLAFFFNTSVSAISTATNTIVATPVTSGPIVNGIAITPDGSRVYTELNANVTAISAATGSVLATVPIGPNAGEIAISIAGSGTAAPAVPALSLLPLLCAGFGLALLALWRLAARKPTVCSPK